MTRDFFAYDPSFTGGLYIASPATPARTLLLRNLRTDVTDVGPGTSLLDKVEQIQTDLTSGNTEDACGTLNALVHQVSAQAGRSLSVAQVALTTSDATNLEETVPC